MSAAAAPLHHPKPVELPSGGTVAAFEQVESQVRSYCRAWPVVFATARGSHLYDEGGRPFLDFFTGAGTLNYGHNHPRLKEALLSYLRSDAIVHALDMHTVAKRAFLEGFRDVVLTPRGLDYRVQFPGPAGTNAVEAALKLARKVTGRRRVISFRNAFHGMTLGALAVSDHPGRRGAGVPAGDTVTVPFERHHAHGETNGDGAGAGTIAAVERALCVGDDPSDLPAAVILETLQAEGGVNAASPGWLRSLAVLCRERGVLLIVDDVQMGCGRTGPFFSFEHAGIVPDIVCLSKAVSGLGLPMALTLLRPEFDVWQPGEHNGTFRGYNPAFVTAAAALDFWRDGGLEAGTARKGRLVAERLRALVGRHPGLVDTVRGRGLVWGLVLPGPGHAAEVRAAAFERGLILETSGARDEVVKVMPPLTATDGELHRGLNILADAVEACADWAGAITASRR